MKQIALQWFRPRDGHLRRAPIILISFVSLAVLAFIDWVTGPNVAVTCFYLIPVFYMTWYGGWKLGILVAPGEFYGPRGSQHVRVTLTATDERIDAAVARLRG